METELRNLELKIDSLTRNLLDCYEELDLIYSISRRLMSSPDICAQLAMIVREAKENFAADESWLFLTGFNGNGPWIVGDSRNSPPIKRINQSLVEGQIAAGRSEMYYDLRQEPGLLDLAEFGPFLCAVLKTEKKTYGALCLSRMAGSRLFGAGDLKLSNVLATFASLSLENHSILQEKLADEQVRFRMEEEIRLAAQIQDALLPKNPPEVAGYDLSGATLPARGVGGDYYDFIELTDGQLAVGLGDVTGKGLAAALLMANLQGTIRSQAIQLLPVEECIHRANRLIFRSTGAERFVTFFFGVLDTTAHRFRSTNAGHNPALLVRADGGIEILGEGGIVLGVLEEAPFKAEEVTLRPGDVLIIFSDGVVEAENAAGEEFGTERIARHVRENRHGAARECVRGLFAAVQNFTAPAQPRDDMTIVLIRRLE